MLKRLIFLTKYENRAVHHCLNADEVKSLIRYKQSKAIPDNEWLETIFSKAEEWEDELSLLCYFLGKIVLSNRDQDEDAMLEVIEFVYSLPSQMFVTIQPMGADFIDLMLRNTRTSHLSLDDELSNVQRKLGEFDYSGNIS